MKMNKAAGVMMFVMSAIVMGGAGALFAQESTSGNSGGLSPGAMTKEHHQPAYSKMRAECRNEAKNQSLTGDDMKNFMKQCEAKAAATLAPGAMTKEHHQPAYSKMSAECRNEAKGQSLTGDDMKNFMKQCEAKAAATLPPSAMDRPKQ